LRGELFEFQGLQSELDEHRDCTSARNAGHPLPHLRQPSHLRCAVSMTLRYLVDETIFILQCPPAFYFC
jgi:hypothetical protein